MPVPLRQMDSIHAGGSGRRGRGDRRRATSGRVTCEEHLFRFLTMTVSPTYVIRRAIIIVSGVTTPVLRSGSLRRQSHPLRPGAARTTKFSCAILRLRLCWRRSTSGALGLRHGGEKIAKRGWEENARGKQRPTDRPNETEVISRPASRTLGTRLREQEVKR